jgi:hypothetical protein
VPKNAQDGYIYTMELITALRGEITGRFEIYEENSGRARFEWQRAESYLLFLYPVEPSGSWSASGPVLKRFNDLQRLPRTCKGSRVPASVDRCNSRKNPLNWGTYGRFEGNFDRNPRRASCVRVQSDQNGEFEIKVPVGKYKARAFRKGWKITMDALTFEDPANLKLEREGYARFSSTQSKWNSEL